MHVRPEVSQQSKIVATFLVIASLLIKIQMDLDSNVVILKYCVSC